MKRWERGEESEEERGEEREEKREETEWWDGGVGRRRGA